MLTLYQHTGKHISIAISIPCMEHPIQELGISVRNGTQQID
jgi:hypothetical protein